MNEAEAREILGEIGKENNCTFSRIDGWNEWDARFPGTICLDGNFSVGELEAMVWWMKNKDGDV